MTITPFSRKTEIGDADLDAISAYRSRAPWLRLGQGAADGLVRPISTACGGVAICTRAAPGHASKLGRSDFYTPAQVERALVLTRLKGSRDAIAFAGLLRREDYLEVTPRLARQLDYDDARALFTGAMPQPLDEAYRQSPISNAEAARRYGLGGR